MKKLESELATEEAINSVTVSVGGCRRLTRPVRRCRITQAGMTRSHPDSESDGGAGEVGRPDPGGSGHPGPGTTA